MSRFTLSIAANPSGNSSKLAHPDTDGNTALRRAIPSSTAINPHITHVPSAPNDSAMERLNPSPHRIVYKLITCPTSKRSISPSKMRNMSCNHPFNSWINFSNPQPP